MDFRAKDGSPLTPWTESSQVFDARKNWSLEDHAITHEKLTGGSGIQRPCTEEYAPVKERLFEDGIFITDIEYSRATGMILRRRATESGSIHGYESI